jgi:hypothetical protein
MEFDGYRGADDVEEEVRNVGEGTDLFTHYAIGLPILLRVRYSPAHRTAGGNLF